MNAVNIYGCGGFVPQSDDRPADAVSCRVARGTVPETADAGALCEPEIQQPLPHAVFHRNVGYRGGFVIGKIRERCGMAGRMGQCLAHTERFQKNSSFPAGALLCRPPVEFGGSPA